MSAFVARRARPSGRRRGWGPPRSWPSALRRLGRRPRGQRRPSTARRSTDRRRSTLSGPRHANGVTGGSVVACTRATSSASPRRPDPSAVSRPVSAPLWVAAMAWPASGRPSTIDALRRLGQANTKIGSCATCGRRQHVGARRSGAGNHASPGPAHRWRARACGAGDHRSRWQCAAKAGGGATPATWYVGHIVYATNRTSGGSAASSCRRSRSQPSVTGVGTLPKVTVPRCQVTVPDHVAERHHRAPPGGRLPGSGSTSAAAPTTGTSNGLSYTDPGAQVPAGSCPRAAAAACSASGTSGSGSGSGGSATARTPA